MLYLVLKFAITALVVVLVAEIAKRSTLLGGLLASLPLVSLLAMFWLYAETRSVEKVSHLATSILWMIVPSLSLFILLPVLLKKGLNFYLSISLSTTVMVGLYLITLALLKKLGVSV